MDNTAEIERIEGLIKRLLEPGIKADGYKTRKALICELKAKLIVLTRKRSDKLFKPVNVPYSVEWHQHWLEKNRYH